MPFGTDYPRMSLRDHLKESTHALHVSTEEAMNSKRILAEDYSLREYVLHLKVLYAAHWDIDVARRPFADLPLMQSFEIAEVASVLKADLESLGQKASDAVGPGLILNSVYEAIGALYVAQGSQLGRMYIANSKNAQFKSWQGIEPQYYSRLETGKVNWKTFVSTLDLISEEHYGEVQSGAEKGFQYFIEMARLSRD